MTVTYLYMCLIVYMYLIIYPFIILSGLKRQLQRGLDRTVSDAQERLSYCAETKLRFEVNVYIYMYIFV